jgi:hypothetical protein
LKGTWGGYPATVVKVTEFMLSIQFEDMHEPTLILMEIVKELELAGDIEIANA